jgi:hypothetical protein
MDFLILFLHHCAFETAQRSKAQLSYRQRFFTPLDILNADPNGRRL